jgi:hypothetical protein
MTRTALARAHRGHSQTYRAAGDAAEASRHWQQAILLHASLDVLQE